MEESNSVGVEAQGIPLKPASKGKRFINMLVDIVGFYLFLLVILLFISLAWPNFMQRWMAEQGLAFVTNIIIFFFYYLIFEGMTLRSPGKLITRTKVVTLDGGVPTLGQIALRTMLRHVPFEWISIFGENAADGMAVPMHDRWSKTVVIDIAIDIVKDAAP